MASLTPMPSHEPDQPNQPQYDAVVLAVPHRVFREKEPEAYLTLLKGEGRPGVLVDVKGVLPLEQGKAEKNPSILYWCL